LVKNVSLEAYRKKRLFTQTPEPRGEVRKSSSGRLFVVQKHASRRLHYDLRLEAGGVLKSWAVPKGPSYDPAEKRLAVRVEDHPIEYVDFEGIIEPGQYGAGTVMVWDKGTWTPIDDWEKGLNSGKLTFRLEGQKLKGQWTLVRLNSRKSADSRNWLLIKSRDEEAKEVDPTIEQSVSAKTGRSLEEIKAQSKEFSERVSGTIKKRASSKKESGVLISIKGRKAPWPGSFSPQMAALVSRVPEGDRWLYEIKFDGYRLLAQIKEGRVLLITRRGQNWTEKFKLIAEELSHLPFENGIFDGEVVVQNPDGTTDFQKLQNILNRRTEGPLLYYVFDLPYLNNRDLTGVPLIERKTLLKDLIQTHQAKIPSILYSDHLIGSGGRFFQAACQHGVEGVIAKRVDSPYLQGRSKYWVKVKCIKRQEFVVGGYTEPKGARAFLGSLLLGFYDDKGQLIYCGNVGTGFDSKSIKTVYARLRKLKQDRSPFASPVEDRLKRDVHWTSPRTVAEVEYSSWTDAGLLRHPSFVGIREDKSPKEVTLEKGMPPPQRASSRLKVTKTSNSPWPPPVRLTHPDKVLYPEQGLTKKDLAVYYTEVSRWILPELIGRPLSLLRCPDGIQDECFFQKHLGQGAPEWVKTVSIEEKGETGLYPVVENLNGLLSLVQLGVLEIHAWGCRRDRLEYPDRMIFDLDPSPEVSKERLIEATLFLKEWLLKNDIRPFLKTTGGKGIHVVIPLKPSLKWEEVKNTSKVIAMEIAHERPELFITSMTKSRRKGRILIDYFRNNRGATSILPYSTRARPGAPVALPISDKDLTKDFLAHPLSISQTIHRLRRLRRDPWQGVT
jgi:bifunctional non-homologous end joining protein LigD